MNAIHIGPFSITPAARGLHYGGLPHHRWTLYYGHDLAKVGVASSSLVSRSKFYNLASAGLVKVRRQRFGFGRTGNKL